MKKTISICLFVGSVLLFAVIWIALFWQNDRETPKKVLQAETEMTETQEFAESMTIHESYEYILKAGDGFLVVYEADGETVLLETNIRTSSLNAEMSDKLRQGIGFSNETDLYDFLESYSS